MRGIHALFPCALLFPVLLAGAQQTSSIPRAVDDLVRAGIANNKDLTPVRQRIAEARGLARQARETPSPVLDLTGTTGRPLGTLGEEQYGAGVLQSIETFGKRGKRARVADLGIGMAEANLRQRSAELAYQIRAAYAEVASERAKLKLLASLIELNADTLRLTEARINEGDVAPLEASLLKVEISRAEVSKRSAQGRFDSAVLELRRLTGLDATTPMPDQDLSQPAPLSLDELKKQALENRPDLQIARLEEEQESAGVELAKAESKPDVTFSAGYSRQYSQFDGLYAFNSSGALNPIRDQIDVLNFGVSVPIRTARSGAGNVQAATARASSGRLRREYLERNIPLELEAAFQRWSAANESLKTLQSGVLDPSNANLSVIREAYKLGQLRLLDVINEQRRLVDTQIQFIDVQTDAARTWAELQRAAGGNLP
jgi:cobalt-zinc-cadmium efflux system outer membrane protein